MAFNTSELLRHSARQRIGSSLEFALVSRDGMAGKLETSLAILNGVLGDYLARTENGLATEMEVFASSSGGRPLDLDKASMRAAFPTRPPPARIVVLVHGLMCTESIWQMPDGADYGTLLSADLGYLPLYVRYNTGLALAESGASFARTLARLVEVYPGPIEEITALGHSMGGLVVRSACHAARLDGSAWLGLLRRAVYLGTPHLGSPIERLGRIVTTVLRAVPDPYTRLVAEIADVRSRGIKDLGDGLRDARHPVPLLPEIEHYLIAASLSSDPWLATLFGDAFVPVGSATNGVVDPMDSALAPSHVKVLRGSGHVSLARDRTAYDCIRHWCAAPPGSA
jgi:triacylglycerol lipase